MNLLLEVLHLPHVSPSVVVSGDLATPLCICVDRMSAKSEPWSDATNWEFFDSAAWTFQLKRSHARASYEISRVSCSRRPSTRPTGLNSGTSSSTEGCKVAERLLLRDDPLLTFSKLGAAWLLNFDERMKLRGFAKELCKAVRDDCGAGEADDLKELMAANRIIPDAYLLEAERRTVYLFEIEDTHLLKPEKLRRLSTIWFRLDCLAWELRILLVDRYLASWRRLPMADVWHSLSSPDPRKSDAERKRQQGTGVVDWDTTFLAACKGAINMPIGKRATRRRRGRSSS